MKRLSLLFVLLSFNYSCTQIQHEFCNEVIFDEFFEFDSFNFCTSKDSTSNCILVDFQSESLKFESYEELDTTIIEIMHSTESGFRSYLLRIVKHELDFNLFEIYDGIEIYTHHNYFVLFCVGPNEYVLTEYYYMKAGYCKSRNVFFRVGCDAILSN